MKFTYTNRMEESLLSLKMGEQVEVVPFELVYDPPRIGNPRSKIIRFIHRENYYQWSLYEAKGKGSTRWSARIDSPYSESNLYYNDWCKGIRFTRK